jgi:hypothetical protein
MLVCGIARGVNRVFELAVNDITTSVEVPMRGDTVVRFSANYAQFSRMLYRYNCSPDRCLKNHEIILKEAGHDEFSS